MKTLLFSLLALAILAPILYFVPIFQGIAMVIGSILFFSYVMWKISIIKGNYHTSTLNSGELVSGYDAEVSKWD